MGERRGPTAEGHREWEALWQPSLGTTVDYDHRPVQVSGRVGTTWCEKHCGKSHWLQKPELCPWICCLFEQKGWQRNTSISCLCPEQNTFVSTRYPEGYMYLLTLPLSLLSEDDIWNKLKKSSLWHQTQPSSFPAGRSYSNCTSFGLSSIK